MFSDEEVGVGEDVAETVVYRGITDEGVSELRENFNIIHFNIRSINKNFYDLLLYLQQVGLDSVHIIVLSECWNTRAVSEGYFIPGFKSFNNESRFNQNDGCIVYVREDLNPGVEIVPINKINLLRVVFKYRGLNFGLTASYRPHLVNVYQYVHDLDNYYSSLDRELVEVFVGDTNIDLLKQWDNEVIFYRCILAEHGLFPYINKPTRLSERSQSLIDHIFVSYKDTIVGVKSVRFKSFIFRISLTDHDPVILSISCGNKNSSIKNNKHYQNNYKKVIDYDKLKNTLSIDSWEEIYNGKDVDAAYHLFIGKVTNALMANTTYKRIGNKLRKIKPWMTEGLLRSIRHRDKLKQKLTKTYSINAKKTYNIYRNKLNKLIKYTRDIYYKTKINEARNNYKKIWQILREATDSEIKVSYSKNIAIKSESNCLLKNPKDVANALNSYFTNIGSKMASQIEKVASTENSDICHSSIFLRPVSKSEIINHIGNLRNNSAPGPDDISVITVKNLHLQVAAPLAYIINLSFETGVVPVKWKESVVVPVYKGGDRTDPSNYRPISLINNFAKIFEQCLKCRLADFLEKHKLICENQFGFRRGLSTEHAVLSLIDNITRNLQNRNKCLAVFLDLAKAFDCVDHSILLDVLSEIGVRGTPHNLFSNYLKHRNQRVKVNGSFSDDLEVTTGVPQGTILGPILFLIYLNKFTNSTDVNGCIISYADDTAIVFHANTWSDVYILAEKELKKVQKWMCERLLSLNVNKTRFLTFTSTRQDQPSIDSIPVHGVSCGGGVGCNCPCICKSSNIKYLGIQLDENLKWKQHIEYIGKRLFSLLRKFYQVRDILSAKNLQLIYTSLAESLIRYCILIWGGLFQEALKNLSILQKTLLKILYKKPRTYSTVTLFLETGVMSVRQIYSCSCLMWMFDVGRNQYVTKDRITRNCLNVEVPLYRSTHLQRFVFFHGPKLFNMLPPEIKNIENRKKYRENVKMFVLSNDNIGKLYSHQ